MAASAPRKTSLRRALTGAVAVWGGVSLLLGSAVPAGAAPAAPGQGSFFPGRAKYVAMTDASKFAPADLTVRRGTLVRWVHVDPRSFSSRPVIHDVLSTSQPEVLDSGDLTFQQTYTYWFRKAGTYNYVCTRHRPQSMTGTITVTN